MACGRDSEPETDHLLPMQSWWTLKAVQRRRTENWKGCGPPSPSSSLSFCSVSATAPPSPFLRWAQLPAPRHPAHHYSSLLLTYSHCPSLAFTASPLLLTAPQCPSLPCTASQCPSLSLIAPLFPLNALSMALILSILTPHLPSGSPQSSLHDGGLWGSTDSTSAPHCRSNGSSRQW